MKYIVTDGGIRFIDDEIPLAEALETLRGISAQIEAIGYEPVRASDPAATVDGRETAAPEPAAAE